MSLKGHATREATTAYAARLEGQVASDFFSQKGGVLVSSIGLGTYLGEPDAETDERYEDAIATALASGVNHLDTAVNYRSMNSERAVGRALTKAVQGGLAREAVVVATKGGYVPDDSLDPRRGGRTLMDGLVRSKKVAKDEVVRGIHCLAPKFMETMVQTSRENLGLDTLDVYYLHNPETQLSSGVAKDTFYARCREAFEVLEDQRRKGALRAYGTATWNGYRRAAGSKDGLELERMVEAARAAARSEDHGFRWIQLPLNLGMTEAIAQPTQVVKGHLTTLLDAARRLNVSVVASGSLGQAELVHGLPGRAQKVEWPAAVTTSAQRALLFVRSIPGVATALVGTSRSAHVRENLAAAKVARLPESAMRVLAGS